MGISAVAPTHSVDTPTWYALHTKPHAEQQVTTALQARGFETYLPTIPVWRARRRQTEAEPFFECYSFVRVALSVVGLSAITWVPGLRAVVSSEGHPIPIAPSVIDTIQRHLGHLPPTGPRRLEPGDRVEITTGPLQDLEGIFQGHLSSVERAQVLVNVLGRMTRVEIRENWLRRI
ncbi:MAG: hypothetical protein KIS91_00315 [Anaerolineae bacterium]|nr:hypothetical protein [Anaerolineae bacterium]